MADYFAIPTEIGTVKMANAILTNKKVNVTEFALGDGGGAFYLPEKSMMELRHEVWRTAISHGEINENDPHVLEFYCVVPPDVGGFTIREMALFDDTGDMIAVANTPDIQKVSFEEGVSYDSVLSIALAVLAPEVLEYRVDPHVIIATKKDIETHNLSNQAHPDIRELIESYKTAFDTALMNKANKAAPRIYPLQLAEGVQAFEGAKAPFYCKDDFGIVRVVAIIRRTNGESLQGWPVIAYLPTGFLPFQAGVQYPITTDIYNPISGTRGNHSVCMRENGELFISMNTAAMLGHSEEDYDKYMDAARMAYIDISYYSG